MTRKPTPREIAEMIREDQYGLPMLSQGPGEMSGPMNAGPQFDQGGGAGDNEGREDVPTQMNQCSATSCAHNQGGRCSLEAIEINERGGCEQFEAGADNAEAQDDDGRYAEDETDVTGGGNTPYPPRGAGSNQPGSERHWQTGRWDPKGGGY